MPDRLDRRQVRRRSRGVHRSQHGDGQAGAHHDQDVTRACRGHVGTPLTFGPFADPNGDFMTQLVDVDRAAVVQQIRMLRGGSGPNVELFQYSSPDQDRSFLNRSSKSIVRVTSTVRNSVTSISRQNPCLHGAVFEKLTAYFFRKNA